MKKLFVFVLLAIMLLAGSVSAETITGRQAEEVLKATFPNSISLGINWADRFVGVTEDQAWDILTGSALSGNEPYTNRYVPGVYKCGNFAKDSVACIRNSIRGAAVFTMAIPGINHSIVAFITPDKKVMVLEPQNTNLNLRVGDYVEKVAIIRN
uniref:Uncharacterized protein n=1 Tax=viral metagenome TaxID=1070528 RepID=A0A6H1ZKZ1_9ZZZZ